MIKTLLPEAEVKVCLRRRTQMILQKTVGFTDLYTDWTLQWVMNFRISWNGSLTETDKLQVPRTQWGQSNQQQEQAFCNGSCMISNLRSRPAAGDGPTSQWLACRPSHQWLTSSQHAQMTAGSSSLEKMTLWAFIQVLSFLQWVW